MGRIADEIIRQIRDRVDVVDLVGRHVSLRKAGRNYKGLCPFHDEKTPSFNVNPERGTFYCFGCHEGGNAITFLMRMEGLSFPEAVRALGRDCGIEVPDARPGESGLAERLGQANELAQARYRAALASPGNPAAAYLTGRGLDAETVARFGLGFAPDAWDTVVSALRAKGVPPEVGERAGLLAARASGGHYDRLRGRVTFPIQDVRGRVVGFGGRALGPEQEPKYLNTPESPIFRKREAFFGLPFAVEPIRRADRAVVVEGYFDLIALHRAGIEESVATCGTALTPEHARSLRRRARHVVLLFDGDEAGQRAVERSLEILLPEGLRVRAAVLPAGEDPDDFLVRAGAGALRELVDQAPPALEVVIRRAVALGCKTPWEKADAVAAVAPLIALIPSAVERGEFYERCAIAVGTEARRVEAAARAAARGDEPREALEVTARVVSAEERKLRVLVQSLVEHPRLAGRLERDEVARLVHVRPLAELVTALIDAAGEERGVDVEEIGERVGDEARALLRSLAAEDLELDEPTAARTIEDTLQRLRERHIRERQLEITRQLRDPGADVASLLREKQQLIAAQKNLSQPPTGTRT